jgi:methionine-rich copper-binding protein CopC
MKTTTRYLRLALPLLGCLFLATMPARAQCSFDMSVPSDGDVFAEAPAAMTIKFLFGIELQNVRLIGSDGAVWPIDWAKSAEDVFEAEFHATKPLPPGRYSIEWTAYVRQHYHPDGGVIAFTVGSPEAANANAGVTPAAAPPTIAAPRAALGWPYRAIRAGAAPRADR